MKNLLLIVVLAVVLVIAIVLTRKIQQRSEPPVPPPVAEEPIVPREIEIGDDATWFDMAYRGLTGEKGTMQYGFAMGYGTPGNIEETPFIKAVRKRAKNDVHLAYNPSFTDRTLSAVEAEGREAKLFYFDCDGNGKISDDEIFAPADVEEYSSSSKQYRFITSDFPLKSTAGEEVPFRAQLGASFYGDQDTLSCMWSPACVLEGQAEVEGGETKLILFMAGLDGDFTRFGRASYALMPAGQDLEYPPRATLSSLIFHNDKFYQLRFEGSCEEGNTLRVALVPDKSPTGHLAVDIKAAEDLKAKVSYATVKGASDKSIHFRMSGSQQFPVDQYVLESGQLEYGKDEDTNWSVSFSQGPKFSIEQGETSTLNLGEPKMAVSSIDENKRYHPEAEDRDTFSANERIYLGPKITGLKGEVYSRFRKQDKAGGGGYEDLEPHLTITDSSGTEIVSQDLEFG